MDNGQWTIDNGQWRRQETGDRRQEGRFFVLMDKHDCFESTRLLYRGINGSDAQCLVEWRSTYELIRFFRNPEALSLEGHIAWFRDSYLSDAGRFDFIIVEKRSSKKIGTVGVNNLDYHKRSCELSYMIGDSAFRRQGFAGEAILAVMGRLKREGIGLFYAEIHRDNTASFLTVERLGFSRYSQEGDFLVYLLEEFLEFHEES